MTIVIIDILLWCSAIGTGLIAGLYFSFSTFIMTALGRLAPPHGIAAMVSINRVILSSLFMPLFVGTTLSSLALGVIGLLRPDTPGSLAMIAAALLYVPGMFLCTMLRNVPLNNALDSVDSASSEAEGVWVRYLREWTLWNHLRTISSTLAFALYIWVIGSQA